MKLWEFIRPYGLFGLTHIADMVKPNATVDAHENECAGAKAVQAISQKVKTAALNAGTVS
jgi:hypothetical protein